MKKLKYLVVLLILFIGIFTVGCGTKKKDIANYFDYSISGYSGKGKIEYTFDEEKFLKYELGLKNAEVLLDEPDYFIEIVPTTKDSKSSNGNFKNGDIITFNINYDKEFFKKEFKVELINSKDNAKVESLPKGYFNKNDLSQTQYQNLKKSLDNEVTKYISNRNSDEGSLNNDYCNDTPIFAGAYIVPQSNSQSKLDFVYYCTSTQLGNSDSSSQVLTYEGIKTIHVVLNDLAPILNSNNNFDFEIQEKSDVPDNKNLINIESENLKFDQKFIHSKLEKFGDLINNKKLKAAENEELTLKNIPFDKNDLKMFNEEKNQLLELKKEKLNIILNKLIKDKDLIIKSRNKDFIELTNKDKTAEILFTNKLYYDNKQNLYFAFYKACYNATSFYEGTNTNEIIYEDGSWRTSWMN
ncbi:hypothetical protein [Paraclostridium bifermentans]|uniref:hypothetical protein n=1 Tax=Paraclostridium bifermentans TaxID=1490 RepID=UPI0018A8A936|nr:hypothetical protein [Paraclostridium bifermentans]